MLLSEEVEMLVWEATAGCLEACWEESLGLCVLRMVRNGARRWHMSDANRSVLRQSILQDFLVGAGNTCCYMA